MKSQWFVRFKAETYYEVVVEAEDEETAEDAAFEALKDDDHVTVEWAEGAWIVDLRKEE